MTTFYMDPIGGNDANAGTSFALRWRTFTAGATAARIAPGDEIRYIASPDPTPVGSATWTNASRDVVLAAACNLTIDNCETNWTPATNVTASLTTVRRQGSSAQQLGINTTFTTGLAAYRTLPAALDLSAFEQVSLYFRSSLSSPSGTFELRLCSDTLGVTSVHTIPLTESITSSGEFRAVVKNFGAPLSASIASVALYCLTDPSSVTVILDNIVACKAVGADNSLTHLSLIGKNTAGEPEWYPIISIDGATVSLGGAPTDTPATPPRPYNGTTESVATYKRQPLDLLNGHGTSPPGNSTNNVLQDSGTYSQPIAITGGWDRTAMSSQTGESWVSGGGMLSNFVSLSTRNHIHLSNFGACHFTSSPITGTTCRFVNASFVGSCGNTSGFYMGWLYQDGEFSLGNLMHNGRGLEFSTPPSGNWTLRARRVSGSSSTSGNFVACVANLGVGHAFIDRIDNGVYGVQGNGTTKGRLCLYNTVFDANTTGDVSASVLGQTELFNATLNSASPVVNAATMNYNTSLQFHKYGGVATDHRTYRLGYTLFSDTVTVHAPSTLSWKITFDAQAAVNITPAAPARFPILKYAAQAGVAKTIAVWVYRSNVAITAGLFIKGGKVQGIGTDQSALAVGAASAWEQVSLSVTPTEDAVIEVFAIAASVTSGHNVYFDDVSIT